MFQSKLKLGTVGVVLAGVTLITTAGLTSVQGQGIPSIGTTKSGDKPAERLEVPTKVAAPAADKLTPEAKAKLEEMVECAKEEIKLDDSRLDSFTEQDTTRHYETLHRLACAQLQLAGPDVEQQIAIRKQQLENCKKLEVFFKRRVDAQLSRPQPYLHAKFERMEIEYYILKLQQK